MLKGFRGSVMRGHVIGHAVAVVIGGASPELDDAVVQGCVDPLIRATLGGEEESGRACMFRGQTVDHGPVIATAITFLITASVASFIVVAPRNRVKSRRAAKNGRARDADPVPVDVAALQEVRDIPVEGRGSSQTSGG